MGLFGPHSVAGYAWGIGWGFLLIFLWVLLIAFAEEAFQHTIMALCTNFAAGMYFGAIWGFLAAWIGIAMNMMAAYITLATRLPRPEGGGTADS